MSITLEAQLTETGPWQTLYCSGSVLEEIRKTGMLGTIKIWALKYPDGKIWDCKLREWRKKEDSGNGH